MATMDTIKLYGGEPANFLDVGGGATAEKVTEAFKIMLKNPHLKAILVNIFGGIMKCDTIAERHRRPVNLSVPLVVRMKGTNEDWARRWRLRPAHHRRRHDGRSRDEDRRRRRLNTPSQGSNQCRSTSTRYQGHHPGHHGQDRSIPPRGCRDYANGKDCFVAGVNPKKAGEKLEGIPIFANVTEAAKNTGATVSVIYVPPAGAPPPRSGRTVEADLGPDRLHHQEGIPVRDMLMIRNRMKPKPPAARNAAAGPELLA